MCKIALFGVYIFLLTLHQSGAICHICNSNGVACASNNTFHLCFGGLPNINEEFSCPNEDEVCTTLGQVCMDPDSNPSIQAACGNTKQCGQCADVMNGGFTCTSRTSFTMCMGNVLTNVRGTCRAGQICRTSVAHAGRVPCVSECLIDTDDMCDVNVAVDVPPKSESAITTVIIQPTPPLPAVTTTVIIQPTPLLPAVSTTVIIQPTPPSTTTTSTSPSTAQVSTNSPTSVAPTTRPSPVDYCSSQRYVGRYPNPADSSCTRYLYCTGSGGGLGLVGRLMRCPGKLFFNPQSRICQVPKPNGCV
ncbi:mucin-2 [Zeugodacus cucurbitae]|uniref:mucin-2 n=1 Tax=Zeugodacus cucurbitae TaxID=28588 RepID=UPI000596A514|nr:mucin-2 [Zeugodacus cucurbitae]